MDTKTGNLTASASANATKTAKNLTLLVALASLPCFAQSSANSIKAPGYSITALACDVNGASSFCNGGQTGPTSVKLLPGAITIDSAGNLYFTDFGSGPSGSSIIRKLTPAGTLTTVAGGGQNPPFLGDGGPATGASLNSPGGVAVDAAENIYISDTIDNRIRKVSADGTISTIAGPGSTNGQLGDGGPATSATLDHPAGLAVDAAGDIFVADFYNCRVRKIMPDGIITTVAGSGCPPSFAITSPPLGDGGPATSAFIGNPPSVAVDSSGNLYIADLSGRVRKVSTAGIITTVAGNGSSASYGDGGQAVLAGITPNGLAESNIGSGVGVDADGDIYIADTRGSEVRMIAPDGTINAVAGGGTGPASYYFNSGPGPATNVSMEPIGVAVGSGGTIYVTGFSLGQTYVWALTPSATPVYPEPSVVESNSASGFSNGGVLAKSVGLGGWMEIYGSYLAPDSRSWATADFNGINAPTSLDGTSVTIGGQPAFVSYISPAQINVNVPSTIGTGSQPLVITTANGKSTTQAVTVNAEQPALLSPPAFNIGGVQYVVALFPDNVTYVLPTGAIPGVPSRPAKAGDTIMLYGIGFGATTPNTPAGQITQATNSLVLSVKASFSACEFCAALQATVNYAGLAPGVVGLYQFNVVVPALTGGAASWTLALDGAAGIVVLPIAVQ